MHKHGDNIYVPICIPEQNGGKRLSAENSVGIIPIKVNDTAVNTGQADDTAVDNATFASTVDSRYLEIEGTIINTTRYPYFDISDFQN